MTFKTETVDAVQSTGARRLLDFLELTKPGIVLMILITAFVGYYLGADSEESLWRLVDMLSGTALAAGGTLALNQFLERDADGLMARTRHRPLPDGRIQPAEALLFGVLLAAGGLLTLAFAVNAVSALVAAFIAATYLLVYTPLKQKSALCGIVGAVPGALPPVIGWGAARGALGAEAWILFAILFLWQVPHTLAIARLYRDDFARAGIRFLPVIDMEGKSTGRQVIHHSLALLVVSLTPTLIGIAGEIYFFAALLLGLGFVAYGVSLAVSFSLPSARRLLVASLIYLPVLLIFMALDHVPL